jgi:hypothetical protein
MYHKLAALKLIKECNEATFKLLDEGTFSIGYETATREVGVN